MYKANLSFTQLNDYLTFMLNNNLITPSICEGREGYAVTDQGIDFLQKHAELIHLLKTSGINKKPNFHSAKAPRAAR